ncbi:MAG: histidine kinase [Candidatus Eisenbacteria bacterium]|nr:histidine kinase [Candidatus Eisenbacteria bacterium]
MGFRPLEEIAGAIERKRVPFSDLMPGRVRRILLVSSLYDSFTFQEDGNLGEMLFTEYQELNLSSAPTIFRVSTAREAIERVQEIDPDLIITMPRVGDMDVFEFGRLIKSHSSDLPVVLLAYDTRELSLLKAREDLSCVDRIFVWLGDARVFLAIIKWAEDRMNRAHDAATAGVMSILLVEDSVRFYSAYLPMLYGEIMEQTQALMSEGVNRMQQLMRMRARPKILLATTFEEGRAIYEKARGDMLGVIVDARFPKDGELDDMAGVAFASMVKEHDPTTPVLIQSTTRTCTEEAFSVGATFLQKTSPTLMHDVRAFMRDHLGFGDFIFRTPDGTEVARAGDLRRLVELVRTVPDESLMYHARRNDFSTWLMARTEFDLAKALRAIAADEFDSSEELREYLLRALKEHRFRARAGLVEEFSSETFEAETSFTRIGRGSLGGKGRGLAFMNSLLDAYEIEDKIPGVRITVPQTAVVATDVFDRFMETSGLTSLALSEDDDVTIRAAFLAARLPEETISELRAFLSRVRYPLAVRSSSLFEDSSYQPFAGIYQTYMLPNTHDDLEVRLDELCRAIRLVYASTYSADSKSYIESTTNRLEEEKMAVVIQQITGRRHGDVVYPNAAGVARTYDHYPIKRIEPEDGVACVALGMGKTVVEGGRCIRFSPVKPRALYQFSTPDDYLNNAQRQFYALDLTKKAPVRKPTDEPEANLTLLDVEAASEHGTFLPVGSVYVPESERIYDGSGRPGVKLVTMAGLLSGDRFPLPETLAFLMEVGKSGFTCHVEIEFAVMLNEDGPHEFSFLQIRPLVLEASTEEIDLSGIDSDDVLCSSGSSLGHGAAEGITDIVYVRPDTFDRNATVRIADEVGKLDRSLRDAGRTYLLIGPGRWGSADRWLGIPVSWRQIAGVGAIVETDMPDIAVDPSQGSHFFQNITSFGIAYLTVRPEDEHSSLDSEWLDNQPAEEETGYLRHIRLEEPLRILVNSTDRHGVILKPGKDGRKTDG